MISVWLTLAVSAPENVGSACCETSIERVLGCCCGKRRVLSYHDEQDYGGCENINRLTDVGLLEVDFWCHVVQSSKLCCKESASIFTKNRCREAEVNQFESILMVQKNVVWLQVPVANASLVAIVEASHKLLEEVAGHRLVEPATHCNKVEELSSTRQF